MTERDRAIRAQLARQAAHWSGAAARLEVLEDLASAAAWAGLERYLGLAIRRHLAACVKQLRLEGASLQAALDAASTPAALDAVRRQLLAYRRFYLRVETTLDFFADAINTRTSPHVAALMKACDTLAHRSMAQALDPLGKPTPVALTYLDKGLGASILKAGLRLWDRTGVNPVATIKITRHNLHRPTALIHETGHQVAHITGWNEELAASLATGLAPAGAAVADAWAGWSSEIAADAFSFAHTGYAAVAALHDVVASEDVFRHMPGDPHPISYARVLLGVEMCRRFYGAGPWDELRLAWAELHPLERAPADTRELLAASAPLLPRVVEIALQRPMRAFDGRPLAGLINPDRVRPEALAAMERQLGPALYTSMHWIWTEALRLLALTGLRKATLLERGGEFLELQEQWMLRLGGALQPT
ncbi:MAG TPA: hypothetical protein VLC53_09990 [Myxococcota bacterium]|nr:hypothetical protein [Myxococcota bacterium]